MTASLDGLTCAVLGATAGIGAAVARTFSARGANIVVGARDASRAAAFADGLKSSANGFVDFERADVTDPASMTAFAEALGRRHEAIDVLVVSGAAAGASLPTRFLDMPLEELQDWAVSQWWSRMIALRACLPLLLARAEGRAARPKAVFLTSDAGRVPTPFEAAPGGAAAALLMSMKVVARELAVLGVCVNAVSVSVTRNTPGLERSLEGPGARVFRRALEHQPFAVDAQDVAGAVAFLASPEADAITGQTLSVNGGLAFPG